MKIVSSRIRFHWIAYAAILFITFVLALGYGLNMLRWTKGPDFGWRTSYNSGPTIVMQLFERGRAAGLRVGDHIEAINGRAYQSFDELFLGRLRYEEPGSINKYTIVRDGQRMEIDVSTGRLGLDALLWRSIPLFVIGLIYIGIGALVFLMKPQAPESLLFLVMTFLIGMRMSYGAPADLLRPTWLYDVRFFFEAFSSAAVIHLALRFPRTRGFLEKRPALWVLPYVPSTLFVLLEATSSAYWNMPRWLFMLSLVYTLVASGFFLGSMAWNALRDRSVVIRLQSQVIFIGIVLGLFVPASDLIFSSLWQVSFFPDPTIGFATFLSLFPLSIGYTIVKHDLFAIDTIVRRTYGYLLSTGSVVASYALIISLSNIAFRSSAIATSPLFSIAFALAVVFLFGPLHRRFQRFVDRVFYRQRYDYAKTITNISEAMTSILDEDRIRGTLVGSVVSEMFLENGILMLASPDARTYRPVFTDGIDPAATPPELHAEDALPRMIKADGRPLSRHDIDLNPRYATDRQELQGTMRALASELIIPLTYKQQLRGFISLGRKKSGKLFRYEDVDLLKTIASQSAVALENAKLFSENLEKGRMEEELKIAHELQASMLPASAPDLKGFKIAARSLPAREVGGDFYDFIPLGDEATPQRLGVIVGDVSGKGVSAALMMAAARSTYRVLLESGTSVAAVMGVANKRLKSDIMPGMFVALSYAVLDTRDRVMTLSNAGQTQPIVCPAGNATPFYVDTEGDKFPLGIVADCDYQETRVPLKEGDVVVFYTDGVVEAMNSKGELYGFDRLLTSIHNGRHLAPDAMLDQLVSDVAGYVGDAEQHDDLTLVVARAI